MLTKQIIIFHLQIGILLLRGLILTAVEDVEINIDNVVLLLFGSVVRDRLRAPDHAAILIIKSIISSDIL